MDPKTGLARPSFFLGLERRTGKRIEVQLLRNYTSAKERGEYDKAAVLPEAPPGDAGRRYDRMTRVCEGTRHA